VAVDVPVADVVGVARGGEVGVGRVPALAGVVAAGVCA